MKQKISITIDEALITEIEKKVISRVYRNKSHAIEVAVSRLVEE